MLAGIVAMQVAVLKLGAGIGRSMQQTSALQSQNEQLRANVASLADDQRIESVAARLGMIMPTPDAVGFLTSRSANPSHAVANMRAPDPSALAALKSAATPTGSTTLGSTTAGTGTTVGTGTTAGTGGTTAATATAGSGTAVTPLAASPPTNSTGG
jgi:cell division protein FtsL